jgi:transcriptional regulator with XRE-family HTH domain
MAKDSSDKKEVARLLKALDTMMRILGISHREMERRLGLQPSSLTRFFNGQVEAKLQQVLAMARALGLEYEELFNFTYPRRRKPDSGSQTAQSIRARIASLQGDRPKPRPEPPPEPPQSSHQPAETRLSPEEIERVVHAVVTAIRRLESDLEWDGED